MTPTRCQVSLCAALSLSLLSGCLPIFQKREEGPKVPTKATTQSLVRYLNQQSALMNSIEANLEADASGAGKAIGLSGFLACEKPRGFRLRAKAFGRDAVDIGSNNEEFWFWVNDGPPNLYHCSYRDLASGKVNVPFPFQPDMVLVALGLANYDPEAKYELKDNEADNTLELVLDTTSPDGKAVKRSVLFRRSKAGPGQPQVVGHVIRDGAGKVVCEARVTAVVVDRDSGGIVPSRVEIKWPSEKSSMKMMLSGIKVNRLSKDRSAGLFTRQALPGVRSVDMATGRPDGASTSSRAAR